MQKGELSNTKEDDFISDISTVSEIINDSLWYVNPKDLRQYFRIYRKDLLKQIENDMEDFMQNNRSVVVQGIAESDGRLFVEVEIKDSSKEITLFTKDAIDDFLSDKFKVN
jgi:maltose-binding protein MalE